MVDMDTEMGIRVSQVDMDTVVDGGSLKQLMESMSFA